jgi:hypothetical protein
MVRLQNAITFSTGGKCALRGSFESKKLTRKFPGNEKPADRAGFSSNFAALREIGAGEGARTLDPDLGKVVLYH